MAESNFNKKPNINDSVVNQAKQHAVQNTIFSNVEALGPLLPYASTLLKLIEQAGTNIDQDVRSKMVKILNSKMDPMETSDSATELENKAEELIQSLVGKSAYKITSKAFVAANPKNISREIATLSHTPSIGLSYRDALGDRDMKYVSQNYLQQQSISHREKAIQYEEERANKIAAINESIKRSPQQVKEDSLDLINIDKRIKYEKQMSASFKRAYEEKKVSKYGESKLERARESFVEKFYEDIGNEDIRREVAADKNKKAADYKIQRAANVANIESIDAGTWASKSFGKDVLSGISKETQGLVSGKSFNEIKRLEDAAGVAKGAAEKSGDMDKILETAKNFKELSSIVERLNKVQSENLILGQKNQQKEKEKQRQEREEKEKTIAAVSEAGSFVGTLGKVGQDLVFSSEMRKFSAETNLMNVSNRSLDLRYRGVENYDIGAFLEASINDEALKDAEKQYNAELKAMAAGGLLARNTAEKGIQGALETVPEIKMLGEGTIGAELVAQAQQVNARKELARTHAPRLRVGELNEATVSLNKGAVGSEGALSYVKTLLSQDFSKEGSELAKLSDVNVLLKDVQGAMPAIRGGRFKEADIGNVLQFGGLLEQKGIMGKQEAYSMIAGYSRTGGKLEDIAGLVSTGKTEQFSNELIKDLVDSLSELNSTMLRYGAGNLSFSQNLTSLVAELKKSGYTDVAARQAALQSIGRRAADSSSQDFNFQNVIEVNSLVNKYGIYRGATYSQASIDEANRAYTINQKIKNKQILTQGDQEFKTYLESRGEKIEELGSEFMQQEKIKKTYINPHVFASGKMRRIKELVDSGKFAEAYSYAKENMPAISSEMRASGGTHEKALEMINQLRFMGDPKYRESAVKMQDAFKKIKELESTSISEVDKERAKQNKTKLEMAQKDVIALGKKQGLFKDYKGDAADQNAMLEFLKTKMGEKIEDPKMPDLSKYADQFSQEIVKAAGKFDVAVKATVDWMLEKLGIKLTEKELKEKYEVRAPVDSGKNPQNIIANEQGRSRPTQRL